MGSVVDTYYAYEHSPVVISDFSPPRKGKGIDISVLENIDCDFISVAANPGKLVRVDPIIMAHEIRDKTGTEVIFNLTPRDMNKIALQSHLLGAQVLELQNLVVMQGDPLGIQELEHGVSSVGNFTTTSLLESISELNKARDYRGRPLLAPTEFCVGATVDLGRNLEREMTLLRRKLEMGAEFLITQPVFEIETITNFIEMYSDKYGSTLDIPIFWGIQILEKNGLSLSEVPDEVKKELEGGISGTQISIELVAEFLKQGLKGIYLVPPIRRGGSRDYEVVGEVVRAFR